MQARLAYARAMDSKLPPTHRRPVERHLHPRAARRGAGFRWSRLPLESLNAVAVVEYHLFEVDAGGMLHRVSVLLSPSEPRRTVARKVALARHKLHAQVAAASDGRPSPSPRAYT